MIKTITVAEWLASLRSGEYKQGRGILYRPLDDAYCCLGVGEKLAKGTCDVIPIPLHNFLSDLPEAMKLEGGGFNVMVIYKGTVMGVSELNDAFKVDFNGIADYVEKTIKEVTENNVTELKPGTTVQIGASDQPLQE